LIPPSDNLSNSDGIGSVTFIGQMLYGKNEAADIFIISITRFQPTTKPEAVEAKGAPARS